MAEAPGAGGAAATATQAATAARFVLHAPDGLVATLSAAYGAPLPETMNRAGGAPGGRAALRLGPDEWLLIAHGETAADVRAALAPALAGAPHSLVEVSDRQIGLDLAGPGAALALNAGTPLDLAPEAFPVGMATRTIFEKTAIVLWRTGPDAFRIEVWRSFAPYLEALLAIAIRENQAAP